MSDNVSVTPGAGVTIAADEVTDGTLGSVKVQYVKLMDGTLDGTTKASVGANGLKVDGSGVIQPVTVGNFPATQSISATNLPLPSGASTESTLASLNGKVTTVDTGNVTVSSPLPAGTNLLGHVILNSGSTTLVGNFPSTQVVVGSVTANAGNNLDTSALALDTTLTGGTQQTQIVQGGHIAIVDASGNQRVSVSNFPATQPVTIDVSGRTSVLKTGTLVTTAVTADQVVLTYTVTSGKTLWLEYYGYDVRLTVLSATASILGTVSLEFPSGTKTFTSTETNPTTSQTGMRILTFSTPVPVTSGTVIRVVCTPAAVTSMTWVANFGGYEM